MLEGTRFAFEYKVPSSNKKKRSQSGEIIDSSSLFSLLCLSQIDALKAAVLGAEVVSDALDKPKQIEEKGGSADIVTLTDKKTEEVILDYIQKRYPDHLYVCFTPTCHFITSRQHQSASLLTAMTLVVSFLCLFF